MKRTLILLTLFSAIVLTAGCCAACKGAKVTRDALASAPERVEFDGREFVLSAFIWRDFMPPVPPGGNPARVSFNVNSTDNMPLPTDLRADHYWLLSADAQWDAALAATEPPQKQLARERVVEEGPKWEVGTKCDLVVRLVQGKQSRLVRFPDLVVKRTD
jgi:hypothetical protein